MSKLFSSIKIKDMELSNRIVMAPMCMYSTDDSGMVKEWHLIHYATRAIGGVGLIILEATAVEKRGRISANDLGIWEDEHIEGLKKIVDGCRMHGSKIGIQLAHAGRKCEVKDEDIIAPSSAAFDENYKTPKEMDKEDIKTVIKAFGVAAARVKKAGFDAIELHAAHGYLINQFLSPLINKREDEYGGSLENRTRFLKEIIVEVRQVWGHEKPLIVRISAEEFLSEGNHPEDLSKVINLVKDSGVDIAHVSSGGVVPANINAYPGYQISYAETIKHNTGLTVIGGGLISNGELAEEIVQNKRADLVFLGRELLRNPYWALSASTVLGDEVQWPRQYTRSRIIRK
jgi:NADPH2 dehydrogenase